MNINVRDFFSVFSHEQVEEIDKRIEKAQKEENARLQKAWDKAKDLPMNK